MKRLKYAEILSTRQTILASALSLCLPYAAWATLPDTGQNSCYDVDNNVIACPAEGESLYGQDAQYMAPAPSYTDNNDGTITDNITHLIWQQDPDTNGDGVIDANDKKTYEEVLAGADALNTQALGGCTQWRVPTIKELYSLIDFNGVTGISADYMTLPDDSVLYIDTTYFEFDYGDIANGDRYIDAQYWSSTDYVSTLMNGLQGNFGVNFVDGRIKGYGAEPDNMRYVRYVCGDSGYGVNKFVDNGDETITDNPSNLMWLQNDSGAFETGYTNDYAPAGSLNWEHALAWCEGLDFSGYTDWRLPHAKELHSIVDYSRSPDATNSAAIDPVFNATRLENGINNSGVANYPYYWTSTSHLNGRLGFAVYVAFGEARGYLNGQLLDVHGAGAQRSDPKTGDPTEYPEGHGPQGDVIGIYNFARCVRDVTTDNTTEPTTNGSSEPTTEPSSEPGAAGEQGNTAIANTVPEASNVVIVGTLQVGALLTGNYTFSDADDDPENTSVFQWYRADDAQGTNMGAIAGATATTYRLAAADANSAIKFCVMPSDGKLTVVPASEHKNWAELSAEAQTAAAQLGYDQAYWDDTETATASPNASTPQVRQPAAGADLETFWNDFDWADLTETEQTLWGQLGWDEISWDQYGQIALGKQSCSEWSIAITPETATGTDTPTETSSPVITTTVLPTVMCPSTGSNTLVGICKVQGQEFTDLTLTEEGNLSGATLSGLINNGGWISNATITEGSVVSGGTLTGFITNNGTLVDITFRGAAIEGGLLMGMIANKRNGLIRNVSLAANAHLTGGTLQGTIEGDCTAPALLEQLTIDEDSEVSCVTLGENVVVVPGAQVQEEGMATPGSALTELAELGQAIATDKTGEQLDSTTTFRGGSAVNGGEFKKVTTLQRLEDTVHLQGVIAVDPEDSGQTVALVVYATYQPTPEDEAVYLMVGENRGYYLWDQDIAHLMAFENAVTLGETQLVDIYQGVLLYTGTLEVNLGYRKPNGMVVLSSEPISITVAD